MFSRTFLLLYAALAYVLALANIAYIVGFLADVGVPKAINDGPVGPSWAAAAIDLGLVWLFGLHHSATARRWFKARWTRLIPPSAERATYLYMTAGMSALLVALWRPIPVTVWQVESAVFSAAIVGLYLFTGAVMFAATFHFGHFGFFGLAQAWARFRGRDTRPGAFCARWLYGIVRHPISLGWILLPWLTPHMTVGQVVFAVGVLSYVLAATPFEERDLIAELGETYRAYRRRVPAFLPRILPTEPDDELFARPSRKD